MLQNIFLQNEGMFDNCILDSFCPKKMKKKIHTINIKYGIFI